MTNNTQNPVTGNGTGADSKNQVFRKIELTVSLSLHVNGKPFYCFNLGEWTDKPTSREEIVFTLETLIKKMSWRSKYEINFMLGPGLDKKLFIQSVTKNIKEIEEGVRETWWSEDLKEYEKCNVPVSFNFS